MESPKIMTVRNVAKKRKTFFSISSFSVLKKNPITYDYVKINTKIGETKKLIFLYKKQFKYHQLKFI